MALLCPWTNVLLSRNIIMAQNSQSNAENHPHALLLLPHPPAPPSPPSMKVAFDKPLKNVLESLHEAASNRSHPILLDIALPCSTSGRPGFDDFGRMMAGLYTRIAAVFNFKGISNDGPGSIDARVMALDYSLSIDHASGSRKFPTISDDSLIPLSALACSTRPWTQLYTVDGEEGLEVYRQFEAARNSVKGLPIIPCYQVPGGLVFHDPTKMGHWKRPNHNSHVRAEGQVMTLGLFDHLHFGHKFLLGMAAFLIGPRNIDRQRQEIVVWIKDGTDLHNIAYATQLQPWETRKTAVLDFLQAVLLLDTPQPDNFLPSLTSSGESLSRIKIRIVQTSGAFKSAITPDASLAYVTVADGSEHDSAHVGDPSYRLASLEKIKIFRTFSVDTDEDDSDDDTRKLESRSFRSKLSGYQTRRKLQDLTRTA